MQEIKLMKLNLEINFLTKNYCYAYSVPTFVRKTLLTYIYKAITHDEQHIHVTKITKTDSINFKFSFLSKYILYHIYPQIIKSPSLVWFDLFNILLKARVIWWRLNHWPDNSPIMVSDQEMKDYTIGSITDTFKSQYT